MVRDRVAYLLVEDPRFAFDDVLAEDDELLAAVAGEDVAGGKDGGDDLRHLGEDRVARLVAVDVVHALEVVEVEHQDPDVLAPGHRLVEGFRGLAEEVAAVVDLRQVVVGRHLFHPAHLVLVGGDVLIDGEIAGRLAPRLAEVGEGDAVGARLAFEGQLGLIIAPREQFLGRGAAVLVQEGEVVAVVRTARDLREEPFRRRVQHHDVLVVVQDHRRGFRLAEELRIGGRDQIEHLVLEEGEEGEQGHDVDGERGDADERRGPLEEGERDDRDAEERVDEEEPRASLRDAFLAHRQLSEIDRREDREDHRVSHQDVEEDAFFEVDPDEPGKRRRQVGRDVVAREEEQPPPFLADAAVPGIEEEGDHADGGDRPHHEGHREPREPRPVILLLRDQIPQGHHEGDRQIGDAHVDDHRALGVG